MKFVPAFFFLCVVAICAASKEKDDSSKSTKDKSSIIGTVWSVIFENPIVRAAKSLVSTATNAVSTILDTAMAIIKPKKEITDDDDEKKPHGPPSTEEKYDEKVGLEEEPENEKKTEKPGHHVDGTLDAGQDVDQTNNKKPKDPGSENAKSKKKYKCGVQATKYEPTGLGSKYEDGMKEHSWPWYILVQETLDNGRSFERECLGGLIPVKNNQIESDIFVTSAKCITKYRTETKMVDEVVQASLFWTETTVKLDKPVPKNFYHLAYRNPKKFRAFAGLHEKDTSKGALEIETFLHHPGYEGKFVGLKNGKDKYENDVAVVKLKKPIKFNDEKIPICLPTRISMFLPEAQCTVARWPRTGHPPVLQQLDIVVARQLTCNDAAGEYKHSVMLCSGAHYSSMSKLLPETTGAPLACRKDKNAKLGTPDGIWYLSGAAMSGYKHHDNVPFLFARVRSYVEWIEGASHNLSSIAK